jgi:hypothetical protein
MQKYRRLHNTTTFPYFLSTSNHICSPSVLSSIQPLRSVRSSGYPSTARRGMCLTIIVTEGIVYENNGMMRLYYELRGNLTILHPITTAMLIQMLYDLEWGVDARCFGKRFHGGIVENP